MGERRGEAIAGNAVDEVRYHVSEKQPGEEAGSGTFSFSVTATDLSWLSVTKTISYVVKAKK